MTAPTQWATRIAEAIGCGCADEDPPGHEEVEA